MKPLNQWTSAEVIDFVKRVDKKIWAAVVSGTVAALVVIVFFVIPAWVERPLLRRDIQSMEAQIRQVNALNQKRPAWEENQKSFAALIDKTRMRVFTADEMNLLLGQVSRMARESRVDVLASKPMSEKLVFAAPYHLKYQSSGYEFAVQGGYHDLGALASRIESSDRLLRIQRLRITPSERTPDQHIAELKIWAITAASPTAKADHVRK